uniref:J domain-containing protein n=1 Tax=Octactis speculum TaxID=3111310 RepID=A0A7S2B7W7_9STRA|mmetsp:Transcript_20608/g.27994  ORF Transcript_20608/g.27994 Transcript_20608/m.27994 type:complete len:479 (+) Transcript_20608:87-1523(+)
MSFLKAVARRIIEELGIESSEKEEAEVVVAAHENGNGTLEAAPALAEEKGGEEKSQCIDETNPRNLPVHPSVLPAKLMTRKDFCLSCTKGQSAKMKALLEGNDDHASKESQDALKSLVDDTIGQALRDCANMEKHPNVEVCRTLLAHGANPSLLPEEEEKEAEGGGECLTALHYSVQRGHGTLAAMMLKNPNVNINVQAGEKCRTPLHYAAQFNAPKIASLLIQKGAFVDAMDSTGITAETIASNLNWRRVIKILTDPNTLFWNLANRANKMYKNRDFDIACTLYARAFTIMANVEKKPSDLNQATLHYNYARASSNQKLHLTALEHFDRAILLRPQYQSALEERAKCHFDLFNYSTAAAEYEKLIRAADEEDDKTVEEWEKLKESASDAATPCPFATLDTKEAASAIDLKKAYRSACLRWHPDKHVSSAESRHRAHIKFQMVNEAYETLSDRTKRASHQRTCSKCRWPGRGGGSYNI